MSLDAQIDDLYRLPLSDFTSARNALQKTVRGADATHVRTQGKPTLVAWAVNQVYWRSRQVHDRLMKAGEKLRHAQIAALTGKTTDLRDAGAAHRKALADAVKEAERIAAEAGSHPAADGLMRTFEALSLAKEPPARPGRLTEALQPAGFEALAGVTPAARSVRLQADKETNVRSVRLQADKETNVRSVRLQADAPRAHADRDAKKRALEEKRRVAEERKRAAAVKKAEAALERARAKMRAAEEALKRTQGRS